MLELRSGQEIATRTLMPITRDRLRAYAEASADNNPIHLDDQVAKAAGLPGIIAHGMLIAGFMAEWAVDFMRAQEGGWKIAKFNTRFRAMTLIGDIISVSGSVKSVAPGQVKIDIQAKNQRGEIVTIGSAVFAMRQPSA